MGGVGSGWVGVGIPSSELDETPVRREALQMCEEKRFCVENAIFKKKLRRNLEEERVCAQQQALCEESSIKQLLSQLSKAMLNH